MHVCMGVVPMPMNEVNFPVDFYHCKVWKNALKPWKWIVLPAITQGLGTMDLYRSVDFHLSWLRLPSDLPNLWVHQLAFPPLA